MAIKQHYLETTEEILIAERAERRINRVMLAIGIAVGTLVIGSLALNKSDEQAPEEKPSVAPAESTLVPCEEALDC